MNESVQRPDCDIFQYLPQTRELKSVSAAVLDAALAVFDAAWGFVLLRGAGGSLDFQAGRTADGQPVLQVEQHIERAWIDTILASSEPLVLESVPQTVLGIPLVTPFEAGCSFGALILVAVARADTGIALCVQQQAGLVLDNALLHERLNAERARLADVTRISQMQLALDESDDRYTPDSLILADQNDIVRSTNPAEQQTHDRLLTIALDNARLFEAEQRRRRIEQTLRQVTRSLSETLELDEIFNRILHFLRQVIEFDTASVLQYSPDDRLLKIMACYGFDEPERVIGITFEHDETDPLRRPLRDQQPLHVHDVLEYDELFRVHGLQDLHVRSWLNVPLVLRDEVIGTITLDRHRVEPFTEQEIDLAVVFASHAAIAMGNARSYQREQRRRYVEQTLRLAAELLNETLEISEVMDRIMTQIQAVVPCDTGTIQEVRGDNLEVIASYGFTNPGEIVGRRFSLKENYIVEEIAHSLRPVHVPDVDQHPTLREYKRLYPDYQGRTWLGVPLVVHGSFIGEITLDRNEVRPYTQDEIELAVAFASHAAVALENARLFAAEQRQRQVEQTLREVASVLSQTLKLDELLDLILMQMRRVIPFDSASIQRLRGDYVELIAGLDLVGMPDILGKCLPLMPDGVIKEIVYSRQPLALPEAMQDLRFARRAHRFNSLHVRSWLGVPLISKDRVIGAITLDRNEVRPFSSEETNRAMGLAHHAALAIENAELYQQQQAYAQGLVDALIDRDKLIEELDAFAHTVAHDLKNPLSLVIAYSELLRACPREDLLSEQAANYIVEVAHNAERMNGIIDALLVLARVRQAEAVVFDALNMKQIVADVQRRLANVIRERNVILIVPEQWPVVIGFAPWVAEVWANYISNAIKYGGDPPRVELGATPAEAGVRFWVRDNGQGIAPEDFSQLFTPFARLSQAEKIEGHGLGLSIVQRIVERLGGEVAVESELEGGSTFSFTLPTQTG